MDETEDLVIVDHNPPPAAMVMAGYGALCLPDVKSQNLQRMKACAFQIELHQGSNSRIQDLEANDQQQDGSSVTSGKTVSSCHRESGPFIDPKVIQDGLVVSPQYGMKGQEPLSPVLFSKIPYRVNERATENEVITRPVSHQTCF
jgi:hypothetical protein